MLGKHTLKAGEKTELTITFNTTGKPGDFRKDIDIETDAAGQEEMHLTMKGTVKEAPGPKIQAASRKIDLGSIKNGEGKETTIVVTNIGNRALAISKIVSQGSQQVYFDSLKDTAIVIEPGKSRTVAFNVRPVSSGPFADRIAIQSNAKNASKGGFIIIVNGTAE